MRKSTTVVCILLAVAAVSCGKETKKESEAEMRERIRKEEKIRIEEREKALHERRKKVLLKVDAAKALLEKKEEERRKMLKARLEANKRREIELQNQLSMSASPAEVDKMKKLLEKKKREASGMKPAMRGNALDGLFGD